MYCTKAVELNAVPETDTQIHKRKTYLCSKSTNTLDLETLSPNPAATV